MICYAVIDTNVLVSALLSSKDDTATVQVIGKMIIGEIIPIYSKAIKKEYCEVLTRKKFGFSGSTVECCQNLPPSLFFQKGLRCWENTGFSALRVRVHKKNIRN